MTEVKNEYLRLIPKNKGSFFPMRERLVSIGGIYTGYGYEFPIESAPLVEQIADALKIKADKIPLLNGQTFEQHKILRRAEFNEENLIKREIELCALVSLLNLEVLQGELTEAYIESSPIADHQKKDLLTLFNECRDLRASIEWSRGMDSAMSASPSFFDIKPIARQKKNYLLEDAPPTPSLVNFVDSKGSHRPLIVKGVTGMIAGIGGVGKTHLLAQLGLCIASGSPFLGKFPISSPGSVFMGFSENNDDAIHGLIRKTSKQILKPSSTPDFEEKEQFDLISQRLHVMSFLGVKTSLIFKGSPTNAYNGLLKSIVSNEPSEGWSCIILDPISRFIGADAETDNASATEFMELLDKITSSVRGNPTVIIGHHMNKSGLGKSVTDQGAARGSSAITDAVRFQFNLERVLNKDEKTVRDKVILRMVKSNFTQLHDEIALTKDELGCLSVCERPPVKSAAGNQISEVREMS